MSARSCVVSITVTPRSRLISTRNSRTRCRATTSSPIVGSSRKTTSGSCSSDATSSPRMRWPSDSCRTGVARNGIEIEQLPEARRGSRGSGRPAPCRCAAAARTSPGAAGPTRAGSAARTWRRSGGRAGSAPATARAPRPARARGRHEDPREHLHRGRLAGAVRPDVADHVAALDRERDACHRLDDAPLRPHSTLADGEPLARGSRPRSSTARAPVAPHRALPEERGGARRDDGDQRRDELDHLRQAERVVLAEDVERGEVADERDRDEVGEQPPQPRPVDVDRVLREERAAVRERRS